MPLFPEAAPGVSLGEEFDAPVRALGTIKCSKSENSSVLGPKFHRVLDSAVCVFLFYFFFLRQKGESGADRIRPLGVTVLSGIRPTVPPTPPLLDTHTRTH